MSRKAIGLLSCLVAFFSANAGASCPREQFAKNLSVYVVNENIPHFQLGMIGQNQFSDAEIFSGKNTENLEQIFKAMDEKLGPVFLQISHSYAEGSPLKGLARAITYSDIQRNVVHEDGQPYGLTEKFCP